MKNKWLVLCCVGMLTAFAMTGCGSKDAAAAKNRIRKFAGKCKGNYKITDR